MAHFLKIPRLKAGKRSLLIFHLKKYVLNGIINLLTPYVLTQTSKSKTKTLAKAEYDLAQIVDEDQEKTESLTIDFPIAKGNVAKLKITLNCKNIKDVKAEYVNFGAY